MGRGAFIVFEGCDKVGKSTQCQQLMTAMIGDGVKVELLKFPGLNFLCIGVLPYLSIVHIIVYRSEIVREMIARELRYRQRHRIRTAARELQADYTANPELTEFTALDGDDFLFEGEVDAEG
mgnify:CR=1 FL=1